jgi:uncharacterized membrane protein YcaP (DUF421 family)
MLILNAVTIIVSGVLILRIAGRKSISQMSISQTVIMISIGSLLVQPIGNRSIRNTLIIAIVFVLTLLILEFLQIKIRWFETFINGKPKVLIKDGELVYQNLKKVRMTVAKLEMRLRQKGVNKISDIKTLTIEINGEIGYELKDDAKPLTLKDLNQVLNQLGYKTPNLNNTTTPLQPSANKSQTSNPDNSNNIFDEVRKEDKAVKN